MRDQPEVIVGQGSAPFAQAVAGAPGLQSLSFC
jgi:hypothetical protein